MDERLVRDVTFVALDVETTGLEPAEHRVIELGAVRFRLDRPGDEFQQLIDPGMPIPPEATAVNHLTDADVVGQPSAAEALAAFVDWLGGESPVLVAHNAEFDAGFLAHELARTQVACGLLTMLDTLRMARHLFGQRLRLGEVARRYRVPPDEVHRALGDARTVAAIFGHLLADHDRPRTMQALTRLTDSFRIGAPSAFDLPAATAELPSAIAAGQPIHLVYQSAGSAAPEPRIVTPLAISGRGAEVYLSAFCHRDRMHKSYRVDRIHSIGPPDPIY